MLKVVLVDDEIMVLNLLKFHLEQNKNVEIIKMYTSSKQALLEIPLIKPDVAFLDVEMPGMDGVELALNLIKEQKGIDIVFTTAYEKYAIDAFRLNAIHYILKPVEKEDVDEALNRLVNNMKNKPQIEKYKSIQIKVRGVNIKIIADGQELKMKWETSKIEELFSMLVLNQKNGIDKWTIIDQLWKGVRPEKKEHNLYSSIYRLKKTLYECGINVSILNKKGFYFIVFENVNCDM